MNPSPDFYDDDHALEMMPPHSLMEILFEETGLTQPDAKEPLIQITLQGRQKWFTRNLVQCYLSELHHLLARRHSLFLGSDLLVVVNGKPKLRLPNVQPKSTATGRKGDDIPLSNGATTAGQGMTLPCDGVGYSKPDATTRDEDATTQQPDADD